MFKRFASPVLFVAVGLLCGAPLLPGCGGSGGNGGKGGGGGSSAAGHGGTGGNAAGHGGGGGTATGGAAAGAGGASAGAGGTETAGAGGASAGAGGTATAGTGGQAGAAGTGGASAGAGGTATAGTGGQAGAAGTGGASAGAGGTATAGAGGTSAGAGGVAGGGAGAGAGGHAGGSGGAAGAAGSGGAAGAATSGANLIVNGDAEAAIGSSDGYPVPTPGWTVEGEATALKYDAAGGFPLSTDPGPANRGSNFFAGGQSDATSSLTQTISLAANAAAIDGGNVTFTLSAYLGGYATQEDNAALSVSFQSSSSAEVGTAQVGPVTATDRGGVTGLLLRTATGAVPVGTRSAVVTLTATRSEGDADDGYADNLSLVLNGI